jgi:hypothetical protein
MKSSEWLLVRTPINRTKNSQENTTGNQNLGNDMKQTKPPIVTKPFFRKIPAILWVLAALIFLMSLVAPNFLTIRNMLSILDQNAPLLLLAMEIALPLTVKTLQTF